jgi:hypothetical protein
MSRYACGGAAPTCPSCCSILTEPIGLESWAPWFQLWVMLLLLLLWLLSVWWLFWLSKNFSL